MLIWTHKEVYGTSIEMNQLYIIMATLLIFLLIIIVIIIILIIIIIIVIIIMIIIIIIHLNVTELRTYNHRLFLSTPQN